MKIIKGTKIKGQVQGAQYPNKRPFRNTAHRDSLRILLRLRLMWSH